MIIYSSSFQVETIDEAKRLHLVLNEALCNDNKQKIRNYTAKIEKK